ncbi:MAG: glycine cleavage system aminomethyltransferase GcvT [Bacillales bacterium]|nr:glycine cleavage system aminomethyltransferase GcvT [Bacillales bacterium]
MERLKRTPLFHLYKEYGAKTIDFGGWEMPVQFTSIKEEHRAVRERAGLFDVSHMGEIVIKGDDSEKFLQKMVTNDVSRLKTGMTMYTAMCYENGGTVDDLLIYKLDEKEYLLVVNAVNTESDFQWLKGHLEGAVTIEDVSEQWGQLSIQGPLAEKVLQKLVDMDLSKLKAFTFQTNVDIQGSKVLVSRTGYTGEDGFEIYCRSSDSPDIWKRLLEGGKEEKVLPCGLGARDTLRFEACLPLYGQELSADITPIEAGIGFVVKLDKGEFIGKEVLNIQKERGTQRKIVGLEMIDRGIPRNGYSVFSGDQLIGSITTGTQSPTLKKNIGLALLNSEFAQIGSEVQVEIRQQKLAAKVVEIPFYKRSN